MHQRPKIRQLPTYKKHWVTYHFLEKTNNFVWNQWRKLAENPAKIRNNSRLFLPCEKINPSLLIVNNLRSVRYFNRSFNLIWLFRWSWRHQWRSMTTSRTKFILWKRSTKSALRTRTFGASITRQYFFAFVQPFGSRLSHHTKSSFLVFSCLLTLYVFHP